MGTNKYDDPTSFEDMDDSNPTYEKPGTDPGVQDPGKPVEKNEATE
jgi:hypothetical protein